MGARDATSDVVFAGFAVTVVPKLPAQSRSYRQTSTTFRALHTVCPHLSRCRLSSRYLLPVGGERQGIVLAARQYEAVLAEEAEGAEESRGDRWFNRQPELAGRTRSASAPDGCYTAVILCTTLCSSVH